MTNNDILVRLRYALDLKNQEVVEIFALGGYEVTMDDALKILTKTVYDDWGEPIETDDHMKCTNAMLESFLNGLIVFKRGPQEPRPGQSAQPERLIKNQSSVNNALLKKVKIALALKSEDMLEIFKSAGVNVTKGELSALLRKEGHKNYQECGDKYARNFLKGLALKYRS
ncbi:DUF1456 family protein [Jeotgalibacillus sp. R-1-5s-1]|uniref:DUF1456 family protein n=1 Tax=Jeotgalibacillus sp. R-1-5s-1 TaxID=2555897 RepID=UPI00106D4C94|nr:DUF1456 family protein [Jeotgalibacillus sp. R-1-5s-1]TFE01337.1 DUF1456 family protein [Jeotgalibacillus sp. R-1-5s-1]